MRIEERRLSAWRNAPNVVTITSPEWSAWLRMRRKGVGFNSDPPRIQENKKGSAPRNRTWAAEGQGPRGMCLDEIRTLPTAERSGPFLRLSKKFPVQVSPDQGGLSRPRG